MLSKRLAFTRSSISAAGALMALCLAMSGASAQASAPSASELHASQVSSVFSGDAYTNEMGIVRAGDGASLLPEIDDEVLTHEPRTRPHADGIIAVLIGAIGTNDAPATLTAPLGSTKGSFSSFLP